MTFLENLENSRELPPRISGTVYYREFPKSVALASRRADCSVLVVQRQRRSGRPRPLLYNVSPMTRKHHALARRRYMRSAAH